MPRLLKNVESELLSNLTTSLTYVKGIVGEVQFEDYININGFTAYLQDLSEVRLTSSLVKPTLFGLKNNSNLVITTINIDY